MDSIKLRYYGWSALTLQTAQGCFAFDPFFRHYCGVQWFDLQDFDPLTYIAVTHGHEEHFLDIPSVARHTGASIVGNRQVTKFMQKRHRFPEQRLITLENDQRQKLGGFSVSTFGWQHRDINLFKAMTKALFHGKTTQLKWAWSSATQAPFYAPYTGFHVELPNGLTVMNYNEGFNSKMTDAEINELGLRLRTDVLLGGMQLDFVNDVRRGVAALKPKLVILYPPHEHFHEMMGVSSRPYSEFAAAAQAAAPQAKVIVVEPGDEIDLQTGECTKFAKR